MEHEWMPFRFFSRKTLDAACKLGAWILKWALLLGVFLFGLVACLSVSCEANRGRTWEEDPFPDYEVYDYHLRYLHTTKNMGQYTKDTGMYGTYSQQYFRIARMDPAHCVGVRSIPWALFDNPEEYLVLQNPESAVDILREWTVASVEFYVIPSPEREWYPYESTPIFTWDTTRIHYRAEADALYEELLALIEARDSLERHVLRDDPAAAAPYFLSPEAASYLKQSPVRRLCLRLTFEESDAIVWETRCSLSGLLEPDYYLCVDAGMDVNGYSPQRRYCAIREDSALCRAIIAALEAYTDE